MCLCLPRDHGVLGSAEVVLGLVDVSMADPTVQHLHHHIFRACVPDGVGVGGEVAGGVPGGPPHHRPLRRQAAHILERPEEIDRGRRRWRWRRRRGRVGARVGLALGEHE